MTTITREQLHERARRKVKELEFAITQSAFTSIRDGLEEELELARIALAALNDEPVAYNQVQRDMMKDIIVRKLGGNLLGYKLMMADIHAVTMALIQAGFRTAPPAQVVPEECPAELLAFCEQVIDSRITANAKADELWSACRAAMLQPFGNSEQLIKQRSSNQDSDSSTSGDEIKQSSSNSEKLNEPVSVAYKLPELLEGMEVSVDVSTCDSDAGHRYFGTVTEISELDTAKNGYILLVQDAKPNFKQDGNSPVTPDRWIPVRERMPPKGEPLLVCSGNGVVQRTVYGFDGENWLDWYEQYGPVKAEPDDLWQPLPAAPKEVK